MPSIEKTASKPPMAKDWRTEYMEKYYPDASAVGGRWLNLVRRHTPERARVLEIGGGPVDWTTSVLRERASEVVGLDVDALVHSNRLLDQAVVYDGGKFPFPDGRFDVAVSRWVNEHLADPALHFREVHRVLAPGGVYVFRTVNLCHYKTIVARITPHWLQVPMVRWLGHMSEQDHDPYPTYYRANTRKRITALCEEFGLEPVSFVMTEDYPSYGMGSRALFQLFMRYERVVNSSPRFEGLRHTIDCAFRKAG